LGENERIEEALTDWDGSACIPRFFFWVIMIIGGAGLAMQIFREYKVNYLYILEIDPAWQITYHQMYAISLVMLAVWTFLLFN
jgi:hypothetical protein